MSAGLVGAQVDEEGFATSDDFAPPAERLAPPLTATSLETRIETAQRALRQQRAIPLQEYQFREYIQVRERETGPDFTILQVINTLEDYTILPNRAGFNFWIAAPTGHTPQITIDSLVWGAREPSGEVLGPFTQTDTGDFLSPPTAMTNFRITEVDNFRGVGLFRVEMAPLAGTVRADGSSSQAIGFLSSALLRINYPGVRGEPVRDLAERDPYAISQLLELVRNPSIIPFVYTEIPDLPRLEEFTAWNRSLQVAEERRLLLRARLPRGGLYIIEPSDLAGATASLDSIPADEIRIFAGGEELPVYMTNVQRNRFLGRARAMVYVPEDLDERKTWIPLWIKLGEEGTRGRRLTLTPPHQANVTPRPVTVTQSVRVFEPRFYNHMFPLTGPQLRWATAPINSSTFGDFEFTNARPAEDEEVHMKVWLTGRAPVSQASASVFINGVQLNENPFEVRGVRPIPQDLRFPTSLLREGTNVLSVKSHEQETMGENLIFMMADLEIPVSSDTVPLNRQVRMRNTQPGELATITFSRAPETSGQGIIADVADPLNPRFFAMDIIGSPRDGRTHRAVLTLETANTPLIGVHDTLAFRPNDLQAVRAPQFLNRRDPVGYLIVTHPSLMEGAVRMANYRSARFATEIVSTDELYDTFSFGEMSYEAIHRGLKHAFRAREGERLSKVLLLGEAAEFWWEKRRPSDHVTPNMLPIFGWRDPSVTIRGDESYSHLVGRGVLSDVDLSRISVLNNEELHPIIDKTIAYETNAPMGSWRNRHLFVSDDEPEFDNVIAEMIDRALRVPTVPRLLALVDFPFDDYFRVFWRKRSVDMTEELLRQWGEGALTICYMGHGGPNIWSSERILHIRDVDQISVGGRFPILVAGSCDTGWIDYPLDPVQTSLSEHLLKNPIGGVVAAFIPIDGTSSFEHNFLIGGFYDALENRGIRDIGRVTTLAKINYHLHRNNQRVTNQYVMMGCPALMAPPRPEEIAVAVEPEFVLPQDGEVVTVSARLPEDVTSFVEVTLLNPQRRKVLSERVRVVGGEVKVPVQLPGFLREGVYSFVLEATNDHTGAHWVGEVPFAVFPADVLVVWTTEPEMNVPHPVGTPVIVRVEVINNTPRDFDDATLMIRDGYSNEVLTSFSVSLPAGGAFSRTFTVPLPAGINTFVGTLFPKNPVGREVAPLELASSEFKLFSRIGDRAIIDIDKGSINQRATTVAGDLGHQIMIPIVNIHDDLIDSLVFRIALLENEERRVIAEAALPGVMQPNERRSFSFFTNERFPDAMIPIAFETVYVDEEGEELLVQLNLLELDMITGGDLEIVPGSFVLENERLASGRTIFARVDVRNAGSNPLRDVSALLRVNDPWSESADATSATPWSRPTPIPLLMPGETASFRLRWDPFHASFDGNQRLYAVATTSSNERNLSNNVAVREIALENPPNLAIDFDRVRMSHNVIAAFDRVRVSVPFHNESDADFIQEFRISATATDMNGNRQRIKMERFPNLGAGESGVFQFDWRVQPGQRRLEINLNEDREYLELTHDDNVLRKTFPYVVTRADLRSGDEGAVVLDEALRFSQFEAILPLPGPQFTLTRENRTLGVRHHFDEDFVISGAFGEGPRLVDNRIGRFPDGSILIVEGEDVEPMRFRFPIDPNFSTTHYDVVLNYFGRNTNFPRAGHFLVRVQDDPNWRTENLPGAAASHLGSFDLSAGFADVEIRSSELKLATLILSVDLFPRMGRITSPIMRTADIPQGSFAIDADLPGETAIVMAVRFGHGDRMGVTWGEWQQVGEGQALPQNRPEQGFFQWRADLIRANDDVPTLRSVRVLPNGERRLIAQQQRQR